MFHLRILLDDVNVDLLGAIHNLLDTIQKLLGAILLDAILLDAILNLLDVVHHLLDTICANLLNSDRVNLLNNIRICVNLLNTVQVNLLNDIVHVNGINIGQHMKLPNRARLPKGGRLVVKLLDDVLAAQRNLLDTNKQQTQTKLDAIMHTSLNITIAIFQSVMPKAILHAVLHAESNVIFQLVNFVIVNFGTPLPPSGMIWRRRRLGLVAFMVMVRRFMHCKKEEEEKVNASQCGSQNQVLDRCEAMRLV